MYSINQNILSIKHSIEYNINDFKWDKNYNIEKYKYINVKQDEIIYMQLGLIGETFMLNLISQDIDFIVNNKIIKEVLKNFKYNNINLIMSLYGEYNKYKSLNKISINGERINFTKNIINLVKGPNFIQFMLRFDKIDENIDFEKHIRYNLIRQNHI